MNYIVIGGGLAGLVAARALRSRYQDADITVIERNATLGGLLGGVEYQDRGLYFDQGTHIFQETGDVNLDGMLLGAVAPTDLIHFPVGAGDFAGTVCGGRLQSNTHFPDLRGTEFAGDVRSYIDSLSVVPELGRFEPLLSVATARFGKVFTQKVIGPVFARAYAQPAEALAGFAMLLPGWTRVVLDEHANWSERSSSETYRALAAVPDQRDLPVAIHHGRRSYYSRNRGSRAFVEGLADGLRTDGVTIECGTTIVSLDVAERSLELIDITGAERTLTAHGIIIATGVVGAAQLLGMNLAQKGLDRPMPHWIVNVVLEDPCLSDLCYLYGLDASCDWYRVTNYRAFSGDAADRRLTIEVIGRHDVDAKIWPGRLVTQLRDAGLLSNAGIEFADVRKLSAGFPAPTTKNLRALAGLGLELNASLPTGVMLGGIGASGGLFFQNEVVTDIYRRVGASGCNET